MNKIYIAVCVFLLAIGAFCMWAIVINDIVDAAETANLRNIRAIKAMAADKRLKDCVVRDQDMVCTYSLAGVRRSKVVEY